MMTKKFIIDFVSNFVKNRQFSNIKGVFFVIFV